MSNGEWSSPVLGHGFGTIGFLSLVVAALLLSSGCTGLPSRRTVQIHAVETSSCQRENSLVIHLLDVGQGTAMLIECPDGKTQALIDAGNSDRNYFKAEEQFLNALHAKMGTDSHLELAVATHPHPDHIYGFIRLLEAVRNKQFSIGTYVDNGAESLTEKFDTQIRAAVTELGVPYINAVAANTHSLSLCPAGETEEVALEFEYPIGERREELECGQNYNDCSLVNRFSYRGIRVLLAADRTLRAEAAMSDEELARCDADVLLVGHHGNESSSTRMLRAVSPAIVLLSTGQPDAAITSWWGYPEKQVVKRLLDELPAVESPAVLEKRILRVYSRWEGWTTQSIPVNVLSTALDGTIDLYLSAEGICVEREKGAAFLQFS